MEHTIETLLLQKRAGIITESQYKEKMESLKEVMDPTDDELTTIAKYEITQRYGKYNDAIKNLENKLDSLDPNYDPDYISKGKKLQKILFKIKELAKAALGKGKLDPSERVEKLDANLENKYKIWMQSK